MSNTETLPKTVYKPSNETVHVFALPDMFRDLSSASFLGTQLFFRDTRSMFRQSFLGILWAFIPPFFTASVWIFINWFGFVSVSNPAENYPVFVLCGTIIFQTFFEAIKVPTDTVVSGKGMMGKLKFPREAFLISAFYLLLFNFSMKIIALVILAIAFGNNFTWNSLLFLPVSLIVIFCGFSLGVLLIPFQMLYDDFGRILGIGSLVIMYVSPVVYSVPAEGFLRQFFLLNPLTPLITVSRDVFTGNTPEMWVYFLVIFLISFPVLWIGWAVYRTTMPIIIERAGA